jgi:hypothetical protein
MVMLGAIVLISAVAALGATALAFRRHPSRHRYFDSAAWTERRWRDEHERARAAQEHALEDHL